MAEIADVVVAGGGVIGTAIAWRAAAAGLDVVVVDPGQRDGASLVAAGMLAPASEALFGEGALLRLNLLAVGRFGSFAADLELASRPIGVERETLVAALRSYFTHRSINANWDAVKRLPDDMLVVTLEIEVL